ncbi:hypothetical protein AHAS_Ahas06G0134500 [Arachis hypogaea]
MIEKPQHCISSFYIALPVYNNHQILNTSCSAAPTVYSWNVWAVMEGFDPFFNESQDIQSIYGFILKVGESIKSTWPSGGSGEEGNNAMPPKLRMKLVNPKIILTQESQTTIMTTNEAEDRRTVAALVNAVLNLSRSIDLKLDRLDGHIVMVESKATTSDGVLLKILDMVQWQHEKNDRIVMYWKRARARQPSNNLCRAIACLILLLQILQGTKETLLELNNMDALKHSQIVTATKRVAYFFGDFQRLTTQAAGLHSSTTLTTNSAKLSKLNGEEITPMERRSMLNLTRISPNCPKSSLARRPVVWQMVEGCNHRSSNTIDSTLPFIQ